MLCWYKEPGSSALHEWGASLFYCETKLKYIYTLTTYTMNILRICVGLNSTRFVK